jgi:hypothetical protein
MNPRRFQGVMRSEIDTLRREGVIDGPLHQELLSLYPAEPWDWARLGRWYLFFGSVMTAAGLAMLARTVLDFTLQELAVALVGLTAVSFYFGRWSLRRGLVSTSRSLELLGGLTIIGLTFTLGALYGSGSGNWPALLLIDLLVLLPLAYALRNPLLLVLDVVVFFVWFGGVTGYVSGWGAYFFGMNYPVRFLVAGLLMTGMSLLHRGAERSRLKAYDGFFKVWLSGGVFFSEMALWLMSLFGNYGSIGGGYLETAAELATFNVLWAGFNAALLWLGTRHHLRMLRGYAMTFLLIQGYTLYFWKIATQLGHILATFVAGAVTLALVVYVESRRRGGPDPGDAVS